MPTDDQKTGDRLWRSLLPRAILGAAFVWAGWVKIVDPAGFGDIVQNYQLLPPWLAAPVAMILPWVEVICGTLLIVGFWVDGSLLIINVLLTIFIGALASIWWRGIDVDCGCFSTAASDGRSTYLFDIFRDAGLLGIGLLTVFLRHRSGRPS